MFFGPLTFIFILFFFFYILFFFFMVQINLVALAFSKIGIPSGYVFTALFFSLVGSFVNIPVKKIPQESMTEDTRVSFFGFRYVVPRFQRKETVLAVNVGGAVIPTILSIYLIAKTGLWLQSVIATAIMSVITYKFARPIRGVGIALPAFLPPIFAALISVIVAYSYAPVIAYICGTLGTLIGADIINLNKIGDLGAPVASIGGAGTFDGIFLNGVIAVLLAMLLT
ncbi:MAG: DUF1614 domain-containing protein [Deltaproteobacteria bacterium]|nr:DUF1614 domain-containing protein [Deltaproteobacteria bacterium]MBW1935457.1 DUF1614 domain-containing protein [Deltaproteobacteria bacterium]MBW1978609.1 DUF1614 domain-containing protein [Deltaproteobacteria bacterium]MBW2301184.1 DUF1614 domain-containing protein [Deltaproteobacteria bacterium]RLB33484.1 MAG: hypothetical protein DRH11_08830 [Deltaproteobacteria bacterium]